MRDFIAFVSKWDHKIWNDQEQAYNSKISERNRLLKLYPELQNLINGVQLRNECINYSNNMPDKPKSNYQTFTSTFGFRNVSYFTDYVCTTKCERDSEYEGSGNEGKATIPEVFPFCVEEAGQSEKLKHIVSWFPTWQDGICRLVGHISPSKNPSKVIITGAILSYSETSQIFTTIEGNYKVSENIDKKSLVKYIKINPNVSLDMYCSLRQENWFKNIVKLSLQSEYEFFRFSGATTKKFLSKDGRRNVSNVLFERKPPINLSNLTKFVKCSDYESICEELESLMGVVESNGDWLNPLQRILKKCGQNADLVNISRNNKSFHDPFSFRENDLGESSDSPNREDFNSGKKLNSTFTNGEAQLVLWSIVRDEKERFCITGLRLMDRRKKFYQMKPVPITTVIDGGRAVIADKCCYELLGPLYALPVRLTYPEFVNCDYLWPFLPYFTSGLPTNWKTYIYIIDILSKCTLLTYAQTNLSAHNLNECNLSENTMINHSPSFIPSISVLSPGYKDVGNNKENKGSYRRSIRRNSIINSNCFHESNTNNEENGVFKANDKAICQRLSDMSNVFCSLDQTENNLKNRKSILENRNSIKNVCDNTPLERNSIKNVCDTTPLERNSIKNVCATTPLEKNSIKNVCTTTPLERNSINNICATTPLERNSIKNVCATTPLEKNSIIQKSHDVSVIKKDIPLNIENDQVNSTHSDSERKISRQNVKWRLNQPSQSNSNFIEQEGLKTPVAKVKKGFQKDKKINNLRKVIREDYRNSDQIFGDLDSPQSIPRTTSNTTEINQSQSQSQSIRHRKRKIQQTPADTYSKKKKSKHAEKTKGSENSKSIGNDKIKQKNTSHIEETKRNYNRKSVVNAKPGSLSESKARFSKSSDASNQTIGVKRRISMNKTAKDQSNQDCTIDLEWINSDNFFQSNIFFNNTQTTRSGRKSIPPIDPRSCIERLNEGGKSYLVSKGQKFELLPNHPS